MTRTAVAAVALALPLMAVGSAQAAIAGGNPSITTIHPDIRSATLLTASPPAVEVCFDKPLSPLSAVLSNPSLIYLVGYNASGGTNPGDNTIQGANDLVPLGAQIAPTNGDCVDLGFNSNGGSLDLGQFTAVTAVAGAVTPSATTPNGEPNLADSTALLSSTTHSGTAGISTAPGLVGPALAPVATGTPNDIAFVFDAHVDQNTVVANDFWYENVNGQMCQGLQVDSVSGSTVTVRFPTVVNTNPGVPPLCADTEISATVASVDNAVRVWVAAGGVRSVSSNEVLSVPQGTSMPGGFGTDLPSLSNASLSADGASVTYTFDHAIDTSGLTQCTAAGAVGGLVPCAADPTKFFVTLADGQTLFGISTDSVLPGAPIDSLTVNFGLAGVAGNLGDVAEYAVQAGVVNGAVYAASKITGVDSGGVVTHDVFSNSPGTVPIGGNPGAFSRAYTTGADAYAVQFNTALGVAVIDFDQRVAGPANVAQITFLDAAGDNDGSPIGFTVPAVANPGPEAVAVVVPATVLALSPTQVALGSCAFRTLLAPNATSDECTIPQIVEATTVAGHLKAITVDKKAKKAKKATKRA